MFKGHRGGEEDRQPHRLHEASELLWHIFSLLEPLELPHIDCWEFKRKHIM